MHAALPHRRATRRGHSGARTCSWTIDWGAVHEGYCSTGTRKPTARARASPAARVRLRSTSSSSQRRKQAFAALDRRGRPAGEVRTGRPFLPRRGDEKGGRGEHCRPRPTGNKGHVRDGGCTEGAAACRANRGRERNACSRATWWTCRGGILTGRASSGIACAEISRNLLVSARRAATRECSTAGTKGGPGSPGDGTGVAALAATPRDLEGRATEGDRRTDERHGRSGKVQPRNTKGLERPPRGVARGASQRAMVNEHERKSALPAIRAGESRLAARRNASHL